jgi:hypothetical protein
MNFSRLSKEKRNQLILVLVTTCAVLAGLGFGVIHFQRNSLARLAEKRAVAETKLQQMQEAVNHAARTSTELAEARKNLAAAESDIASGDLYSWMITTIRRFRAPHKVEIPAFAPIGPTTDVNLLANFPYKQTSLSVQGSAHYHDLGRFLADFENRFPHMRVANLSLDLDGAASEPETLSFRMDIIALVKPNAS